MALTQADLDRILGTRPTAQGIFNANQPSVSAQRPSSPSLSAIANVLNTIRQPLDVYGLNKNIPVVGGITAADVTGLNQVAPLAEDVAYGRPVVRGGSLQTMQADPRLAGVLDFIPAAGLAAKGGQVAAKAGAREIARQIETGTGAFGKGTIDPRMYVYKPTFPSKPLPEGVGSTFEREQVRDLLPVKDLSSNDILGASIFTFPADSTNFGLKTLSISGNKIKPEFQTVGQGGIPFGRSVEHQSKDIAFASNEGAATGQHNRYEIERLKNLARGGSGRIIVAPTTMKNVSNEAGGEAFSLQPVRQINALVKSLGMQPSDLVKLDDMVRNTKGGKYKGWVGMADPYAMEQLATANGVDVGKADLVKKVYEKYISKDAQKTLGYNVEDLKGSLLDPRLIDAPANNMGELWYEVNFNKGLTPSSQGSLHDDYLMDMGGNYLGTTKLQKTGDVFGKLYDDILANIPTVDKNGKKIPQATRELNAINVLRSQKENASLFVDEVELERLKRLLGL
jgi:hypothetical protein